MTGGTRLLNDLKVKHHNNEEIDVWEETYDFPKRKSAALLAENT